MSRIVDYSLYLKFGWNWKPIIYHLLFALQLDSCRFHQVRKAVVKVSDLTEVVGLDRLEVFDLMEPNNWTALPIKWDKKLSTRTRLSELDRFELRIFELYQLACFYSVVDYFAVFFLWQSFNVDAFSSLSSLDNQRFVLLRVNLNLDVVIFEHFPALTLQKSITLAYVANQISYELTFGFLLEKAKSHLTVLVMESVVWAIGQITVV